MDVPLRQHRRLRDNRSIRRILKRCCAGALFSGKCFPCFSAESSFSDTSSEYSTEGSTKLDPPPAELRLLCSYGGRFSADGPFNPTNYRDGDNRIIGVDRHCSAAELFHRLSTTLLGGRSFTLKYCLSGQGPNTLVTVVTDEDLKYMIEEYDRFPSHPMPLLPPLGLAGQSKKSLQPPQRRRYLRVYLFPKDPENASLSEPISPTAHDGYGSSDFDDFSDDEPPLPQLKKKTSGSQQRGESSSRVQ